MSVTLIAGLGNPGREYAGTRHNLGFVLVEALAAAEGLKWKNESRFESETARWDVRPGVTRLLVKPQTFMNESGRAPARAARLPQGRARRLLSWPTTTSTSTSASVKVSVTGSAGGHNGIASLLEHVGDGFVRYRLGVGGSRRCGDAARPQGLRTREIYVTMLSNPQSLIKN